MAASAFLVRTSAAAGVNANAGVAAVGVAAGNATVSTAYAQVTQSQRTDMPRRGGMCAIACGWTGSIRGWFDAGRIAVRCARLYYRG